MSTNKSQRTGTCSCGAQFETDNRHQRSCPACIEARKAYEAAHPRPLRKCSNCSAESRECAYDRCPACRAERAIERKRERTLLGKYWEGRESVMREIAMAKKNNWGTERNDALALSINSMLLRFNDAKYKAHAGAMEIHLLTIACQEGTLSPEQCNDLLDNHKIGTPGWNAVVERVYADFFGRPLERKNAAQMTDDVEVLKKLDRHPYAGDRGQALIHAYNKRHEHRKDSWGKPLQSTDTNWKPKEESQPAKQDKNDDELRDWIDERLSRQDEAYGGRYGYGVKMPRKSTGEPVIDPEQVDHPEQERIDAIFAMLMEDVDL